MKDTRLEDTELYDGTSVSGDDDEDEYVPDSTTDPEDSDASSDVIPMKSSMFLLLNHVASLTVIYFSFYDIRLVYVLFYTHYTTILLSQ